jgi:hypothetical protein
MMPGNRKTMGASFLALGRYAAAADLGAWTGLASGSN